MHTSSTDYKTPEGNIDWDAFRRAQVQNGEICYHCGSFLFTWKGEPAPCGNCLALENDLGEVLHPDRLRCPHCHHVEQASDREVWADGDHEIDCGECGEPYIVSTSVSFTFRSPALWAAPDGEEG
jgi:ribosomal protein S27AE